MTEADVVDEAVAIAVVAVDGAVEHQEVVDAVALGSRGVARLVRRVGRSISW